MAVAFTRSFLSSVRWAGRPWTRATLTCRRASTAADLLDPTLGLTEEQRAYYELARDFAEKELLPHAARHDEAKSFPEDALRAAAELGFGGLYVTPESGGTGLSRLDGSVIVEALAGADTSTTAYLTIHNVSSTSL